MGIVTKTLFIALSFGLSFGVAAAQTPTAPAPSQSSVVIFADIQLTGSATTTDGTLYGSYTLSAHMGKQNGINVGVVLYGKDGLIIDATPIKQGLSLQQGEVQSYPLSYTIPTYLTGTVRAVLVAETDSGLPLGYIPLATLNLEGSGQSLMCSVVDMQKGTISCSSAIGTNLAIVYGKGGPFAPAVFSENRTIKKGEKVTFTPSLAPGKYTAHITDATGNEHYSLLFFIPGTYGVIGNVAINSTSPGVLHAVVIAQTSTPNTSTTLTLTSKQGEACGTQTAKVMQGVAQFTMQSTCKEGTVQVALLDDSGNTIDTKNEPFSIIPVQKPSHTTTMEFLSLFGAVVLLIVLVVIMMRTKKAQSIPVTMLLIAGMFSFGASHAQAVSFTIIPSCSPYTSYSLTSMYGTASLASYTVAGGSNVTLNGYFTSDDNPQPASGINPILRGAINSTSYGSDMFTLTYTQAQIMSGVSSSISLGAAPTTAGSYPIDIYGSSGCYTNFTGTDTTNLTVQQASVSVTFQ